MDKETAKRLSRRSTEQALAKRAQKAARLEQAKLEKQINEWELNEAEKKRLEGYDINAAEAELTRITNSPDYWANIIGENTAFDQAEALRSDIDKAKKIQERAKVYDTAYNAKNELLNTRIVDNKTRIEENSIIDNIIKNTDKASLDSYVIHNGALPESIDADLEDIRQEIMNEMFSKKAYEYGKEFPVIGTVASVASNLMGGALAYSTISKDGRKLKVKRNTLSDIASNLRAGASSDMSDTGEFLYNTAVSMTESVLAALMSGSGGMTLLGMSAGTQTANDVLSRGGTSEQALVGGIAAGVFEAFFEKFSIGALKSMQLDEITTSWKGFMKNLGKQTLTNATEEGATEIANTVFDTIALGDISNWSLMINEYVNQGMTLEQARKKAASAFGMQTIEAMASGAIMGSAFGLGGAAVGGIKRAKNGKAIINESTKATLDDLIAAGEEIFVGDEYKKERELLNAIKKNKSKNDLAQRNRVAKLDEIITKIAQEKAKKAPSWEGQKKNIVNDALDDLSGTLRTARSEAKNARIGKDITYTDMPRIVDFKGSSGDAVIIMRSNGTVAKLSDMSFEDGSLLEAYFLATKTGSVENANRFIEQYRLFNKGISIEPFWLAWMGVQNYGQTVNSENALDNALKRYKKYGVPETALMAAFLSGRNLRKSASESAKAAQRKYEKAWKEAGGKLRDARFDDSAINVSSLTEDQKEYLCFLKAFSRVLGANIEVFASEKGSRRENGSYSRTTNTLRIDINAGISNEANYEATRSCIINTLSHETVHNMREVAPEEYEALRDFVVELLQEDEHYDFDKAIETEIERAAQNKKGLTREDAVEEIVARACENCLGSSETLKDLLTALYIEDKRADNSFVRAVRAFLTRLKRFFENISKQRAKTQEADIIAGKGKNIISEIQKRFDTALLAMRKGNTERNGITNKDAAPSVGADADKQNSDVKYQMREENSKDTLYIYKEKEYNDFGWAEANGFLSAGENADYLAKFAMLKARKVSFPKTKRSEYMIAVSDIYDYESEGVENVIVYAKGTIEHPIVTKVIRIEIFEETEKLDKKRREFYDIGRRGLQPKIGELCRFYYGADGRSYGVYKRDSLQNAGSDGGRQSDGGAVGGKAARAEGIGRSGGDIIYYHDVDDVKINSESSFDITANEVETIRSIGKKSISQFNLEDMEKAHNWEQKFNRELGIKSPFFRARFGDWRAYETTKITPISFSVKISSRSDAEQYLKEGLKRKTLFRGNVKNNDSGFLINIGAHIYNDTLTYANSQYSRDGNKTKYINRISLLSKIEDIVKHSVLLDTETVKKESKNPNQLFVHRLFSVAQNQYEKYLVKLTVNELISVGDTVRRAYNIDNIEISPVAVSRDLGPADTTDDINGEYLSINSISDLFAIVKRYDRSFSPKPVDHKLLNADGTPNAFYVGTESVSAENKLFNNGDALMLETDMSEQKKDVRYQDRDLYTEKEYNDFGWARANDFLSAGENANYRAKFAMLKTGQARFPKTKNGEYMIAVSDIISAYKKSSTNQLLNIDSTESPQLTPEASFDSSATKSIVTQEKPFVNRQSKKHSALDSKSNGVENVIVYAKGTIEHPIITKVLRIDLFEESEKLDKKRREIYDTGRRGLQPKIGELCRFYYGAGSLSFGEYKRDKLSHDRNNLGFNTDRETGSGKAARAKGIGRTPEGHIIYYHEEPSKMSQDTNENQTMYQYRIEEPSPGEILQDLFAENSSYNGYKEYAVSLNKYRDMLERVGDLNKEIQDIDAKIGELRSQHRQSGKGTRMDDLYQKRIRCEGKIEKLKNRMLKMEAKQLRKVIEAEERRAVASAEKRQRDKYFAQSKERREREIKRYYIDNIQKQVKAMSEQFKTNNARKRIPDELKAPISELLTAIDFSSRKSLIFGTQTEKEILLKNAVKRIQELSKLSNADGVPELDLPPRFAEEWDKVVAFVSTLAKGNSSDPPDIMILEQMEVSDLRALDRSIGDIQHAVSVANEIISKANAEPITELSEKMAKYLNERPMIEKDGALSNFLKWENTLPIYAFDRLGTVGSQLFEAFQDGFDKLVTEINEITEFTRSVYTEDEVKRWSKEVYSFDCETLDGEQRKIYLTVPQIMSFYCLSKREHAGPHFQGGGIVSENIKAGKERYINDARGVRLSDETIEQIISRLSPRQKEVADKLQSFLSNDCADWGNEISMKRYGIRMFLEYNYFPIATKESGRTIGEKATHQGAKMYEILNMSFTKPISEQANCQIIISDIFDVFAEHAGSMARYHSLALPVLDFLRVYNYSGRRYGADNTHERTNIRDSMKNAYGLGAIRYFNDFLTTISGGNWAHDASTLQSKLTKGAKVAMVGFNIRSAIQQPTAAVRALMYLGVSDMSLSLSPIGIKKARDLAMKYCPMAVWKSMGHFDIGTGRGMAEIIRNTRTVRDKSIEASMYLAEKADEYTWAYLWKACEHYISRTTSLSEGSEEYYKAVGKKLREVIYKTQVVDSPLTRSQFMSSTSELKKMTAMFASEGTVTYNMLLDAVSNDNRTKNQKRRAVAAICGIYAVQAILLAAVQSAVDGMRDDDEDEEYGDKYLEAFISNLISELNPLNKLPYIRDLISALEGYATSRTDTTLFSKLGNAVRALWRVFSDENITVYKTVYRLLDAASTATGIAVSNALRDIIALWNTVIGELYPELKIK